jgi:hypothetical protein
LPAGGRHPGRWASRAIYAWRGSARCRGGVDPRPGPWPRCTLTDPEVIAELVQRIAAARRSASPWPEPGLQLSRLCGVEKQRRGGPLVPDPSRRPAARQDRVFDGGSCSGRRVTLSGLGVNHELDIETGIHQRWRHTGRGSMPTGRGPVVGSSSVSRARRSGGGRGPRTPAWAGLMRTGPEVDLGHRAVSVVGLKKANGFEPESARISDVGGSAA